MNTLIPQITRMLFFLFLVCVVVSCSKDGDEIGPKVVDVIPPPEDEPVPIPSPLFTFGTASDSAAIAFEVVGDPDVNGSIYTFNATEDTNNCGRPGGDYIVLDTIGAMWDNGFSVAAWVEFQDQDRYFERIIDFGNNRGELGGMNITFSRLARSADLALTSWINSDSLTNREQGRLIARDAIVDGEFVFYAGTISPSGEMKIYINGELVKSKNGGHAALNIHRNRNFIGHSNWCSEDMDFKGRIDGVYIYNEVVPEDQMKALYEYFID